jgi:hypothetical protein
MPELTALPGDSPHTGTVINLWSEYDVGGMEQRHLSRWSTIYIT